MKILIVDDDPKLRGFLRKGLEEQGYECSEASTVAQAEVEATDAYDLVLLDVMLPDGDGWEVLQHLRGTGHSTPVIFLTARSLVDERVQGLEMGADDYIIKPFEFRELLARIQVVLRRRTEGAQLEWGALHIESLTQKVRHGNRALDLSPKEYALLRHLVKGGGKVASKAELLSEVWGMDFHPGTNVVEVGVARLRRKLEVSGPERIDTVAGEGYRMAQATEAGQ